MEANKILEELILENRKRIAIFGVGKLWEKFKNHRYLKQFRIVSYFDNNKSGMIIDGVVVMPTKEVTKASFDYILIMSNAFSTEMRAQLLDFGIAESKILDWGQFIFRQRLQNADKSLAVVGLKELNELKNNEGFFKGFDLYEIYDDEVKPGINIEYGVYQRGLMNIEKEPVDNIVVLKSNEKEIISKLISKGLPENKIVTQDYLNYKKKYANKNKKRIAIIGYPVVLSDEQFEIISSKYQIIAVLTDKEEYIGDRYRGVSILPIQCAEQLNCDLYICEGIDNNLLSKCNVDEKTITDFDSLGIYSDKKNVLVFGTGVYLKNRIDDPIFENVRIIAFIDNDEKKWGTSIRDIEIMRPEYGVKLNYDIVVIMSKAYYEMKQQLISLGVEEGKISNFIQLGGEVTYAGSNLHVEEVMLDKFEPLVSIIVPNYNHEKFLRERLDSIYNQTYKNIEVLLLDDCSKDNSTQILDEYAERYQDITAKHYNTVNAGKAFLQWEKGINLAKGSLIWIAESDDYSEEDFLEKLVKEFRKESVMLAFARSVFVKKGEQVWSQEEYLHDIPINWRESFVMSAHELVNKGFCIKNLVPNVSSCVFRKPTDISNELHNYWRTMNLCGDWMFYLEIIKGGSVSYRADLTNYYRIHDGSTSLKIQKQYSYFNEQAEISKYIIRNYNCNNDFVYRVLQNLKIHLKDNFADIDINTVDHYYNVDEIMSTASERKPNIGMCVYGICSGGGETYPLFMANELRRKGYPVTVYDLGMGEYNYEIRKKLNNDVPLVRIKNLSMLYAYFKEYGTEVVHSHHASVDETISDCIKGSMDLNIKQIITLHGMYEAVLEENATRTIYKVLDTCGCFVYIADKNLIPFIRLNQYDNNKERFIKLPNGLPQIKYSAINRESLGIGEDDFVLCLVSRAIKQKGWYEAIEAVTMARKRIKGCNIHLLLLGDGDVYEELKNSDISKMPYIHLLGSKNNVRDYFAMADMGLLPTWFEGESYPLVVIECLMSGKPVMATDVAEVKNQLKDENGELAGELIHIYNGKVDVNELTDAIVNIAEDHEKYELMKARTGSAALKFDISNIVDKYVELYKKIL